MDDPARIRISPPSASYVRETIARLPLADAVLHLLRYVLLGEFLDEMYERHRGRGYEDILSFSSLVNILADALLVHEGSGRKALLDAQKHDQLPTVKEAFYGKLRRLPIDLSIAFLTEASERIRQVFPTPFNPLPESLHGYDVIIVDGKKTKHVSKRLKLTRKLAGQLFGAKFLVGYDPVARLIRNAAAHPDGERNDSPLVPDLLADLDLKAPQRPRIIVSDSQFCDLVQIDRYRQARLNFVLRYHPKVHFHPDPAQRHHIHRREGPASHRRTRLAGRRRRPATLLCASNYVAADRPQGLGCRYRPVQRREGFGGSGTDPGCGPDRRLLDSLAYRDCIPGSDNCVRSQEADRQHTRGNSVPSSILHGDIQRHPSDPRLRRPIAARAIVRGRHLELHAVRQHPPRTGLGVHRHSTGQAYVGYQATREPRGHASVPDGAHGRVVGTRLAQARNKNPRVYGPKRKGSGAHTSVYRVLQEHKLKSRDLKDTG